MKKAYPAKVLLAWGEAIMGNRQIRDWLMKNGYLELGIFVFALRNQTESRDWLMKNGFPHLMATINGSEGNGKAVDWLLENNFDVLAHVALSGDGDDNALNWLKKSGQREFAMLSLKIRYVKDEIERDNNDIHRISPD